MLTRVIEVTKKLGPPCSYVGVFIEETVVTLGPLATIYLFVGLVAGLLGSGFLLWKGYYPLKGTLFIPLNDYQGALTHIVELNQQKAALERRLTDNSEEGAGVSSESKDEPTPLAPNGNVIIDYKGRVRFSWNDPKKDRSDYTIQVQRFGDSQGPVPYPYSKQGGDHTWTVNLFDKMPFGEFVWTIRNQANDSKRGVYRTFAVYPSELTKLQTLHTIVVGTSLIPDQLFFEYDKDGKASGFEPQLVDLLVQHLRPAAGEIRVAFRFLAWNDLLPRLASNELDAVISSMTKTRAREMAEGVKFSNGYFTTHQRFVVKRGMAQCLASKQIGVVGGDPKTTNEIAAELLSKQFRFVDIKRYKTAVDLFKALDSDDIDAALVDDISAQRNYREDDPVEFYGPDLDNILRELGFYKTIGFDKEQFGIVVSRDAGDLATAINQVIDESRKSGALDRLSSSLFRTGLKRTSTKPLCS